MAHGRFMRTLLWAHHLPFEGRQVSAWQANPICLHHGSDVEAVICRPLHRLQISIAAICPDTLARMRLQYTACTLQR
jgi:hypothetical protein